MACFPVNGLVYMLRLIKNWTVVSEVTATSLLFIIRNSSSVQTTHSLVFRRQNAVIIII